MLQTSNDHVSIGKCSINVTLLAVEHGILSHDSTLTNQIHTV